MAPLFGELSIPPSYCLLVVRRQVNWPPGSATRLAVFPYCQRAVKTSQGAKMKSSHFEWREIRRGVASTTQLLTEAPHGELAQDGNCSDDTTVTCVRLVAA